MGRFMEHFNEEGYDWQATRNQALAEGEEIGKEIGKEIGDSLRIIKTVRRLIGKGRSADSIADDLGEDIGYIKAIEEAVSDNPQLDDEGIYTVIQEMKVTK